MMMEMRYGGDAESFIFPAKIVAFPVIGGNKSEVNLLDGFVNQNDMCQNDARITEVASPWHPHVFSSPPRADPVRDKRKTHVSPVPGASISWHPHVYSSPPKILTPHCIVDIIGRDGEEPLNLTLKEEESGKRKKASEEDKGRKKMRTTFTGRQIFELEKMFEVKKYLNSSERSDMSRLLNVTEQQVKIWFQNRRTKWKKQENVTNEEAAQLLKNKGNGSDENAENKDEMSKKTLNKSIHKSNQQNPPLHKSIQQNSPNPFIPSIQPKQFDAKCLSMPILDSGLAGAGKADADFRPRNETVSYRIKKSVPIIDSDGEGDSDDEQLSVGDFSPDLNDSSNQETSVLVIDEDDDIKAQNVQ